MRLARIGKITFISVSDLVDMLREIEDSKYVELANVIETLVFEAEIDHEMGEK